MLLSAASPAGGSVFRRIVAFIGIIAVSFTLLSVAQPAQGLVTEISLLTNQWRAASEPLTLNASFNGAATWQANVRSRCTGQIVASKAGSVSAATSVQIHFPASNIPPGPYSLEIVSTTTKLKTKSLDRNVEVVTASESVGFQTLCPDGTILKVGSTVTSQSRALLQIAERYRQNASSAVVVRASATIRNLLVAGNIAALTDSIVLVSGKNSLRASDKTYLQDKGIESVFLVGSGSEYSKGYVKSLKSLDVVVRRFDPANLSDFITYQSALGKPLDAVVVFDQDAPHNVEATHFASRTNSLALPFEGEVKELRTLRKSFTNLDFVAYGPESFLPAKIITSRIWAESATARAEFVQETIETDAATIWIATNKAFNLIDIAMIGFEGVRILAANRLQDETLEFIAVSKNVQSVVVPVALGANSPESFVQAARTLYVRDNAPAVESLTLPALAPATVPPNFTFSGSGWGHGIGMSQWGAFAMAEEGKSAAEILTYYFQGTEVKPVIDNADLWVNLHNRIRSTTVSVSGKDARWRITSAEDQSIELVAGATATFTYQNDGNTIRVVTSDGQNITSSNRFTVIWSGTRFSRDLPNAEGVLEVAAGSSLTGSKRYRFGSLRINAATQTDSLAAGIQVTNRVSLHNEYLYGIGEVSNSWPEQALIAQAIAARSFAYSRVFNDDGSLRSRMGSCDCMVYADIRDQNYVGYSKITSALGDRWKAAVDATTPDAETGLAVVNKNQVVQTFYAAATGGHSQNNEDVWGGTPRSFYRGVEDPWSLMPAGATTVSTWSPRVRSQAAVANAFGLPNVVTLDLSDRFASGGIRTAVATSLDGKTSTITGEQFRSRIRSDDGDTLQSTWVWRALVENNTSNIALGPWLLEERSVGFSKSPALTSKTLVLVQNPQAASASAVAIASSFAARNGSALVVTRPSGDVTRITKLILERGFGSVSIIGALDQAIVNAIESMNVSIKIYSAKDEFELAASVAEANTDAGGYVLANPEQASALPLAVSLSIAMDWPLLYSPTTILSTPTEKIISSNDVSVVAVGSQNVLSDFALATLSNVKRLDTTDVALASHIVLRMSAKVNRALITIDGDTNPIRSLTALSLGYSLMYADEQYEEIAHQWLRRQSLLSMILNFSADATFVQSLRRA